jgi:hypothetical protein
MGCAWEARGGAAQGPRGCVKRRRERGRAGTGCWRSRETNRHRPRAVQHMGIRSEIRAPAVPLLNSIWCK